MSIVLMLLFALLLDALFGEPEWLWDRYPHPATVIGKAINWFDETLNTGENRKAKGAVMLACLCLGAFVFGRFVQVIPDGGLLEIVGGAILLAHRSLTEHVEDVADALRNGLANGQESVSMIVGRDANQLDESGVARSAIESAAENFSDAVIAPAFWFLLLGLPGILLYKVVNTADSMVGYKTKEYSDFGYASAKLDDVLNWIPARISAVLICLSNLKPEAFATARRDADLHRSPNAGWPESAVAGVLNIALAGPRSYDGQMTDDPFVNPDGKKDLGPIDVEDSVAVINKSWLGLFLTLGVLVILSWLF